VLYASQWNAVSSDLGDVANGKTIDRILLAYDNPTAKADTRSRAGSTTSPCRA